MDKKTLRLVVDRDESPVSFTAGYDRDLVLTFDEEISDSNISLWIKSKDNAQFSYETDDVEIIDKTNYVQIPVSRKDTETFKPGEYKWTACVYNNTTGKIVNTPPETFIVETF